MKVCNPFDHRKWVIIMSEVRHSYIMAVLEYWLLVYILFLNDT